MEQDSLILIFRGPVKCMIQLPEDWRNCNTLMKQCFLVERDSLILIFNVLCFMPTLAAANKNK